MRPAGLLLVLLLAPLAAAATAPAGDGAIVDLTAARMPGTIAADHPFAVSIDLVNRGKETRQVSLYSFLYQHEEGKTCGTQADPRFLGRVDRGATPAIALDPYESATYPFSGGLPWWHSVNATQSRGDGTYQICVIAYDFSSGVALAYDQIMTIVSLRVDNRLPEVDFSWSPAVGNVTTEYRFAATTDADPDGDVLSYRWEFGHLTAKGAAVGEGAVVLHLFYHASPFPRSFEVNLTVSDGFDSAVVKKTVVVQPESVAAPQRWEGEEAARPWWAVVPASGLVAAAAVTLAALARQARSR